MPWLFIGIVSFFLACIFYTLYLIGWLGNAYVTLLMWGEQNLGPHSPLSNRLKKRALDTFKVVYDEGGAYDLAADVAEKAKIEGWTIEKQHYVYQQALEGIMYNVNDHPKANPKLFVRYAWWNIHKDEYSTSFMRSTNFDLGKIGSDPVLHYASLIRWSHEHNGKMPSKRMSREPWIKSIRTTN